MRRLRNTVILLGATVFLVAGVAKILALTSTTPMLEAPNPIFQFVPNSLVVLVAATLEIVVAILAIWWRKYRPLLAVAVVCWMASALALYRLGLASLGYNNTCSCFGLVGAWLFPSSKEATAATVMLAAILVPGYVYLLHSFLVTRSARPASAYAETGRFCLAPHQPDESNEH